VRNSIFTANIKNGVTSIKSFKFSNSGYEPKLKNGTNTIKYSPETDGDKIDLQFVGQDAPYSITFNGSTGGVTDPDTPDPNPLPSLWKYNAVMPWYQITFDPEEDDNYLQIQMFENNDEEPDVFDLTINYGEGMEGCLSNIFDRTTSKMTTNDEFEDGIIRGLTDILDGTELRLNFLSDDFTITEILVNGVNETSKLENEGDNIQQYFTLTMTQNTTVTINGIATAWNDITYTGYVSDPDGVLFGLSMDDYNLDYTVVGDCGGQTYGVLKMPEGSKEIKVTVSEKNNNGNGTFYFKPKSGYFISVCYVGTPNDSETSGTQTVNSAIGKNDNPSFYMVLDKMDPEYTANMNVHVSGYPDVTYMSSSKTYSEQNDNPAAKKIQLTSGESEITFIPNYDNPFTLSLNQNQSGNIYLDGAQVTGKANNDTNQTDYVLDLYAPQAGETSDIHSAIDVYFTGSPAMSNAILNLENNAKAEFYYSPVMHEANPEGQALIVGTLVSVKPISADAVVLYKGNVQTLDANGMFKFNTTSTAADNVVTVTGPKPTKIAGMIPKAGSTVKSLDGVTFLVPMTIDDAEVTLEPDLEKLNQTIVTLGDETVATIKQITDISELEPTPDESGKNLLYPIKFNTKITAEGENYFVKVPEGAFVEKKWDETSESFVLAPGGYTTNEYSGRFNIDPSLASPLDEYTLTPATGQTVTEISTVALEFPDLPKNTQLKSWEFENATFSNGQQTVEAIVTLNSNVDILAFNITPVNDEEEPTSITEEGTWTLTIKAGTITLADDDSTNEVITAKYTVEKAVQAEPVAISVVPANGSIVKSFNTIKVSIPAENFNIEESHVAYIDKEKFQGIKVTKGEEVVATCQIPGFPETDEETNSMIFTLMLTAEISEAGEYTIVIPEGAFVESEMNMDEDTMDDEPLVPVAGGAYTAAYTGTVKVEGATPSYTLSPEPGVAKSLSMFTVTFSNATAIEENEDAVITLVGPEYNGNATEVKVVGNTSTLQFKSPTTEGEYTLTIPAGAFTLDGDVESEEIVAKYTLKTGWVLIPTPGTTVDSLNEFIVSFPEATSVEFVGSQNSFILGNSAQTYAAPGFDCVQDETASVPTFKITLLETAQKPVNGDYKFMIEEGSFNIDGEESMEIYAEYTLDAPVSLEYELNPNNGTIILDNWGIMFAVMFDETATVSEPDKSDVKITIDGTEVPDDSFHIMAEGNMLMFMITDDEYNKEGALKLEIKAGAFKIEKEDSPAIEGEWEVTLPKTFAVEITSANGVTAGNNVSDLGKLYLYYPEATSVKIFNEYGASLMDTGYSYNVTGKIEIVEPETRAAGVKVAITFDPAPTKEGNYTLSVREGTLVLDGIYDSPEISETYIFDKQTGIWEIYSDANGNVTVFSLDGKVVLNNVPAAQLRELEKG
ncbi:MAG: hypothetical protein K2H96_06300, partial [Muribaculaceae bacterium]|nr:hypothetical protein [Muribaculaceae bacterium]